jgi:serine O-acetyltransferase
MITKISNAFFTSFIRILLKFGIDETNAHVLANIFSDLYRYTGNYDERLIAKEAVSNPGFRFTLFLRICETKPQSVVRKRLHAFSYFFHRKYFFKYGYQIPIVTNIGEGFQILHMGHIIINPAVKIGSNCTIFPGVTIGQDKNGLNPTLGDKVWIGSNSIIVGGVYIGCNVLIAPGSYVNFDVPDNCLVIGNPGRYIIKTTKIIDGYLNNTI